MKLHLQQSKVSCKINMLSLYKPYKLAISLQSVSLIKIFYPLLIFVLVQPRKKGNHPDTPEKLLKGT